VSGDLVGFVYRSQNGFESEPLAYGTYVKPFDGLDLTQVDALEEPFETVTAMRAGQEARPDHEEFIPIGGQVWRLLMHRDGAYIVQHVGTFDDYPEVYQAALTNQGLPGG
jgi:hypothetical protein